MESNHDYMKKSIADFRPRSAPNFEENFGILSRNYIQKVEKTVHEFEFYTNSFMKKFDSFNKNLKCEFLSRNNDFPWIRDID